MSLKITFLGTGGAFTDYRVNYHNNAVLETADGPILIDCGTTAVQSLKELGISPLDIQAVMFTHLHGDHASPEMLMFERAYGGTKGPQFLRTRMIGPSDLLLPLQESLAPYVGDYIDREGKANLGGVQFFGEWVETTRTMVGGIGIEYFRVPHVVGDGVNKPAYGMKISSGGAKILWSGDTIFSRQWIEEADPKATIFHECMFFPKFFGTVHSHYDELKSLPPEVRARIVLMHYTQVPAGIDPVKDGFMAAAKRHETFEID